MDNGIVDRMFTLYGKISGEFEGISPEFIKRNEDLIELQKNIYVITIENGLKNVKNLMTMLEI